MRILILLSFLISSLYVHAQDSLQSHIENGKFYGIFPVTDVYVVYADSIVFNGFAGKDSIYDKARAFFDKKEDAKYYFESENKEIGEFTYQGELSKSLISKKSDVHFTLSFHCTDTSCVFKLGEIVIASEEIIYAPGRMASPGHPAGPDIKTGTIDHAVQLENITLGKGEFSRRYCEKMDRQFLTIMDGLRKALL